MTLKTTCSRSTALWTCLITGVLTGCDDSNIDGGSSSCTDDFSPLDSIETTLGTFRTGDSDDAAHLDRELTLFSQYFQAIEPVDGTRNASDGRTVMELVEEISEPLVGFQGGFPDYDSTRNAFDLIESMDASGQHEPLRRAREAVAACIEEGEAGGIQVPNIRVTEEVDGEDPEEEGETWRIAGIGYNHNPTPLEGQTGFGPNVSRGVLLENGFLLSLYDIDRFAGMNRTSGYKSPGEITLALNPGIINEDDDPPSLLFESVLRTQLDKWSWSLPDDDETITIERKDESFEASCLRVIRDYGEVEDNVTVEFSEESCPAINSAQEQNEWEPDGSFLYTGNPDISQRARR